VHAVDKDTATLFLWLRQRRTGGDARCLAAGVIYTSIFPPFISITMRRMNAPEWLIHNPTGMAYTIFVGDQFMGYIYNLLNFG
jgi:hypothetical protein